MLKRFLSNFLFRRWLKPLWHDLPSIERVRSTYDFADRLGAIGRRNVPVTKQNINGVHIEWIGDADATENGVIVYLHGGAFAVRTPLTDRRYCKKLSRSAGLPVALVAYRLAPEHPYPAGPNDCYQFYEALLSQGIPSNRIVFVAHSAGANITLVLLMRARQRGLPQPAGAVLLSPPTDMTAGSASSTTNAEKDPMLGPNIWLWVKGIYFNAAQAEGPEISPLFGDWSGLAPMQFQVSDTEVILDDSLRAVERAKAAGCDTELIVWHDVPHSFPFIDHLAEAKLCQAKAIAFIKRTLNSGAGSAPLPANLANSSLNTNHFTMAGSQ